MARKGAIEDYQRPRAGSQSLPERNVGHEAAVAQAPAVVVDRREDAWDGGAGQQGGQERTGIDQVGRGGGNIRGDGGKRKGEIIEAGRGPEQVSHYLGEARIREEVTLRSLERAGLGQKSTREDLLAGDSGPGMGQTIGGGRGVGSDHRAIE